MRIGDRIACGFDRDNLLCYGLHIHGWSGRDRPEIMLDFFGFYLNAWYGKGRGLDETSHPDGR